MKEDPKFKVSLNSTVKNLSPKERWEEGSPNSENAHILPQSANFSLLQLKPSSLRT